MRTSTIVDQDLERFELGLEHRYDLVESVRRHPVRAGVGVALAGAAFYGVFGRPVMGAVRIPVPPYFAPTLVFVRPIGDGEWLRWDRAWAFLRMQRAAARDGVVLKPTSGFRGLAEQTKLYAAYVARAFRDPIVAKPGLSNHQAGDAVDIQIPPAGTAPNDPRRIASREFQWLVANAGRFGFKNDIASTRETWHWSTTGR